jgi:hypothetical protein
VDLKNQVITVRESKRDKKSTIPLDETVLATHRKLPSRFTKGLVVPAPKSLKSGKEKTRCDAKRAFDNLKRKATP